MDCLSHRIDPRFLHPLAGALKNGPLTDLEIRALFLRDVPNRNLSLRTLQTLLDLAGRGDLLQCVHGQWRLSALGAEHAMQACLETWVAPGFVTDPLFQHRCAVCLDRGLLSAHAEYASIDELVTRAVLSPPEWSRMLSGSCDLRQLTGRASKHSDADYLMLYRSADTAPITDDADVVPRIPRSMLPALPASSSEFLCGIRHVRQAWNAQLATFLAGTSPEDFSSFIVYAKDLLDLFFWGQRLPLRSTVAPENLPKLSERVQRYGLRAEDFSVAWRSLPGIYRIISRLSWGVRFLSNYLSHPQPPQPDAGAFLRICNLPGDVQAAISTGRSGHGLLTLTRTLRVLYRALREWRGHVAIAKAAEECAAAIAGDQLADKLLRRTFADRVRRLRIVPSIHILDAFSHEIVGPRTQTWPDETLMFAELITSYAEFYESAQGRAYAEIRLALHSELDFQNRFNVHSLSAPQRYAGIWSSSLPELVTRVENTRRACIPHRAGSSIGSFSPSPSAE